MVGNRKRASHWAPGDSPNVADLHPSQCSPVGHRLPCGSIGTTTGVDQIAADLLHRPSRQSRARRRHKARPKRSDDVALSLRTSLR
jgi:hypothetical protein